MKIFLRTLMTKNKREYLKVCLELGHHMRKKHDSNSSRQRYHVTFLNQLCRIVNARIIEMLRYNYNQDYQGMMIHAAQGDKSKTYSCSYQL
jgi:hypothetical protein